MLINDNAHVITTSIPSGTTYTVLKAKIIYVVLRNGEPCNITINEH